VSERAGGRRSCLFSFFRGCTSVRCPLARSPFAWCTKRLLARWLLAAARSFLRLLSDVCFISLAVSAEASGEQTRLRPLTARRCGATPTLERPSDQGGRSPAQALLQMCAAPAAAASAWVTAREGRRGAALPSRLDVGGKWASGYVEGHWRRPIYRRTDARNAALRRAAVRRQMSLRLRPPIGTTGEIMRRGDSRAKERRRSEEKEKRRNGCAWKPADQRRAFLARFLLSAAVGCRRLCSAVRQCWRPLGRANPPPAPRVDAADEGGAGHDASPSREGSERRRSKTRTTERPRDVKACFAVVCTRSPTQKRHARREQESCAGARLRRHSRCGTRPAKRQD
jgi:hypothetical protein